MADISALRATIADLSARLEALPSVSGDLLYERDAAWVAYKQAELDLADYLCATYGARIADKAWTCTIRMHGISSSGTSGRCGAMWNWLRAAERKAGAS